MSTPLLRVFRFVALAGVALATLAPTARAAVTTPPAPTSHFNDYANYVPAERARALDARLAQFERDSSNQLVVAIFPRLPAGAALEDYTVRTAQAWGVGRKDRDNGAVLFVFVADRALRIEVGYGLEGSLTDAVAHAIIENELKPRLRAGDPGGALDAAVNAMITATRGEYLGTGRTPTGQNSSSPPARTSNTSDDSFFIVVFGIIAVIFLGISWVRNGFSFQNPYRDDDTDSTGGGWFGGSSSGGGGGGSDFSGGGGSFGGGGASGSW